MKSSTALVAVSLVAIASIAANVAAVDMLKRAGNNLKAVQNTQFSMIEECAFGNNVHPTSCEIQAVVVKGPAAGPKVSMLNPPREIFGGAQ